MIYHQFICDSQQVDQQFFGGSSAVVRQDEKRSLFLAADQCTGVICLCDHFPCKACPGTGGEPRVNRGSTAGFVPPSVCIEFRLFVLLGRRSGYIFYSLEGMIDTCFKTCDLQKFTQRRLTLNTTQWVFSLSSN